MMCYEYPEGIMIFKYKSLIKNNIIDRFSGYIGLVIYYCGIFIFKFFQLDK